MPVNSPSPPRYCSNMPVNSPSPPRYCSNISVALEFTINAQVLRNAAVRS